MVTANKSPKVLITTTEELANSIISILRSGKSSKDIKEDLHTEIVANSDVIGYDPMKYAYGQGIDALVADCLESYNKTKNFKDFFEPFTTIINTTIYDKDHNPVKNIYGLTQYDPEIITNIMSSITQYANKKQDEHLMDQCFKKIDNIIKDKDLNASDKTRNIAIAINDAKTHDGKTNLFGYNGDQKTANVSKIESKVNEIFKGVTEKSSKGLDTSKLPKVTAIKVQLCKAFIPKGAYQEKQIQKALDSNKKISNEDKKAVMDQVKARVAEKVIKKGSTKKLSELGEGVKNLSQNIKNKFKQAETKQEETQKTQQKPRLVKPTGQFGRG